MFKFKVVKTKSLNQGFTAMIQFTPPPLKFDVVC